MNNVSPKYIDVIILASKTMGVLQKKLLQTFNNQFLSSAF